MAILSKRTMLITEVYAPTRKDYNPTRDGTPRIAMQGESGWIDIPLSHEAARKLKVGQKLTVTIES